MCFFQFDVSFSFMLILWCTQYMYHKSCSVIMLFFPSLGMDDNFWLEPVFHHQLPLYLLSVYCIMHLLSIQGPNDVCAPPPPLSPQPFKMDPFPLDSWRILISWLLLSTNSMKLQQLLCLLSWYLSWWPTLVTLLAQVGQTLLALLVTLFMKLNFLLLSLLSLIILLTILLNFPYNQWAQGLFCILISDQKTCSTDSSLLSCIFHMLKIYKFL